MSNNDQIVWGILQLIVSSAGASYNLDYSRARAYFTCSRCGWGLFGHFYSHLSFLPSLGKLPVPGRPTISTTVVAFPRDPVENTAYNGDVVTAKALSYFRKYLLDEVLLRNSDNVMDGRLEMSVH